MVVDKQRKKKKTHTPFTIPPLVPDASGTFRPRLHKYEDFVIVSDTLEGLSVPGASLGVGGAAAVTKPLVDKKRKEDTAATGGAKPPKLRKTRGQCFQNVSPRAQLVPPTVRAERLSKKTEDDPIADTLDVSDKLIDLFGCGDKGAKSQSPLFMQTFLVPLLWAKMVKVNLQFSRIAGSSFKFHHPPWSILQGDEVMNDPSACREALKGLGTPTETVRARGFGRQSLQNQRLEKRLEKQKDKFERLKKTEEWAASSGLKQVRSLANLLTKEPKLREYEKFFRLRHELNNLKAEAEARAAVVVNELADANADRSKLNNTVEELHELKTRESILRDVTSRATEAEARARQAEEDRYGLATSLAQVTSDRAWMRQCGGLLDALKNTAVVANVNEHTCQAGFKAGYNQCLNDVNPFFASKFPDERYGFHGVDTEAAFDATVDAYNSLTILAVDQIKACLEVDDYVNRLRLLFEPRKEGEGTSGGNAE
ncbi:hypothetical protein Hanom_Chr01g00033341 [Helianthus anomalus]